MLTWYSPGVHLFGGRLANPFQTLPQGLALMFDIDVDVDVDPDPELNNKLLTLP